MSVKERLKALIEAIYLAYKNALTEPQKPPGTPLVREEIQERERQKALRVLEEIEKRMGDV